MWCKCCIHIIWLHTMTLMQNPMLFLHKNKSLSLWLHLLAIATYILMEAVNCPFSGYVYVFCQPYEFMTHSCYFFSALYESIVGMQLLDACKYIVMHYNQGSNKHLDQYLFAVLSAWCFLNKLTKISTNNLALLLIL